MQFLCANFKAKLIIFEKKPPWLMVQGTENLPTVSVGDLKKSETFGMKFFCFVCLGENNFRLSNLIKGRFTAPWAAKMHISSLESPYLYWFTGFLFKRIQIMSDQNISTLLHKWKMGCFRCSYLYVKSYYRYTRKHQRWS